MRLEKSQTNATNVTMPLLMHSVWRDIWKCTPEKSHTNATNATLLLLMQAIWGNIWERTVEKSHTNVTSVTLHPLVQAIWWLIWKGTVEKSRRNATSVTLQLLRQEIWSGIWKSTLETKANKCNQCGNAFSQKSNLTKETFENTHRKNFKEMKMVWLCTNCLKMHEISKKNHFCSQIAWVSLN